MIVRFHRGMGPPNPAYGIGKTCTLDFCWGDMFLSKFIARRVSLSPQFRYSARWRLNRSESGR